jgi:hypothetical protein
MGKLFRECLTRNHFGAVNTFFPTGKTYYSQHGTATRIDFLGLPIEMIEAKRCSRTEILEELGDLCQYIVKFARADHFPLACDIQCAIKYKNMSQLKHIDRDALAAAVKSGGTRRLKPAKPSASGHMTPDRHGMKESSIRHSVASMILFQMGLPRLPSAFFRATSLTRRLSSSTGKGCDWSCSGSGARSENASLSFLKHVSRQMTSRHTSSRSTKN